MRTKAEIFGGIENPKEIVDFLGKCRMDFAFFCEQVLGLQDYGGIHKFQMEWFYLSQNNERVVIRAPSGFSKTTILGVAYPLWLIWNFKHLKILLLSKTVEQSKENLLLQIRTYIEDNELLNELIPDNFRESWNMRVLRTTTGCVIMNRPYSVNVKGVRADIIILDEAASYENTEIYWDYVVPRLNPGGKIIIISTPESSTDLLAEIEDKAKSEYIIRNYPAIVNCKVKGDLSTGESIWAERFSMEWLMKKMRELEDGPFKKNYMCDIKGESEKSIFKLKHIIKGFDIKRTFSSEKESEDSFVILACDFAISSGPRADYDAYVIIEKRDNFIIIKHIEVSKGVSVSVKVSRIYDLCKEFKPDLVVADESNIGKAALDEMVMRGISVIPYKFSSTQRKEYLVTLKGVIEHGKLVIPRNPEDENMINITNKLVEQLLGFIEKESPTTKHKLIYSSAPHDDIAIALAMAVKESTNQITGSFF